MHGWRERRARPSRRSLDLSSIPPRHFGGDRALRQLSETESERVLQARVQLAYCRAEGLARLDPGVMIQLEDHFARVGSGRLRDLARNLGGRQTRSLAALRRSAYIGSTVPSLVKSQRVMSMSFCSSA